MSTYDPILGGPVNLYNVSMAILAGIGLIAVAVLVIRGVRHRVPFARGGAALVAATGIVLVAIGAVVFALLTFAEPNEDLPTWGVFYLLPAAFLACVAFLGYLRAAQAGVVLISSAAVVLVVVMALGIVARAIDPQWGRDQIDAGSSAAAFWFFSLPASVSGLLLLIGGGIAKQMSARDGSAPHPA